MWYDTEPEAHRETSGWEHTCELPALSSLHVWVSYRAEAHRRSSDEKQTYELQDGKTIPVYVLVTMPAKMLYLPVFCFEGLITEFGNKEQTHGFSLGAYF